MELIRRQHIFPPLIRDNKNSSMIYSLWMTFKYKSMTLLASHKKKNSMANKNEYDATSGHGHHVHSNGTFEYFALIQKSQGRWRCHWIFFFLAALRNGNFCKNVTSIIALNVNVHPSPLGSEWGHRTSSSSEKNIYTTHPIFLPTILQYQTPKTITSQ